MEDQELSRVIATALQKLETEGELVVTCPGMKLIAERVANQVRSVVPHTGLSQSEMLGLRRLMLHALADERFFDWEMPTLTGFSREEFQQIAEKLPRD